MIREQELGILASLIETCKLNSVNPRGGGCLARGCADEARQSLASEPQMLRVLIEADSDRLRKLKLTGKDHGPGFPAATEAELRRLLREAIEARKEADKCARIAGQTLGKAQEHVCEAGERATALKAAMSRQHRRECPRRGRPGRPEGRFAYAECGGPMASPHP